MPQREAKKYPGSPTLHESTRVCVCVCVYAMDMGWTLA